MKLTLKKCFAHTHTHTRNLSASWTNNKASWHYAWKRKKWTKKKWLMEQLKGVSNKTKSRPLGVKKYFVNTSPPKWPLDWLQQLIHFGTLTWGVWGAYQAANNLLLWYIHYITLHTLVRQFSRALSIGNDATTWRKDGVLAYICCTGYNKQKLTK